MLARSDQTMSDVLGESIHVPHEPAAARRVRVAAAVVWDGDRLLLTQRPPGGPLGLQWELPGGKIEEGESPAHALVRELREELGVAAEAHEVIQIGTHDYPHGLEVELTFIRCTVESTAFHPGRGIHAVRWCRLDEVDLGQVLAADREFLRRLGARPPLATRPGE
jgi:8-oxo-dGTP diphosphatase